MRLAAIALALALTPLAVVAETVPDSVEDDGGTIPKN